MKVNWNTKYNTICVYTFILVCSIILFYLSISQLGVLWGKIGKNEFPKIIVFSSSELQMDRPTSRMVFLTQITLPA